MKRAVLTGAILASLALPAHAAEFKWWKASRPDSYGIKLSGTIVAGDIDRFTNTFSELLQRNYGDRMTKPLPADFTVTVHLNSEGGVLGDAIKIGAVVKKLGFDTYVADSVTCASSCGLIWLAGAKRYVGTKGHIGFHAIYNPENRQVTSDGNAIVGAYSLLGFDYSSIAYLTQTPPDSMQWLSSDVAKQYGIKALTCADGVCRYN